MARDFWLIDPIAESAEFSNSFEQWRDGVLKTNPFYNGCLGCGESLDQWHLYYCPLCLSRVNAGAPAVPDSGRTSRPQTIFGRPVVVCDDLPSDTGAILVGPLLWEEDRYE